MTYKQYYDQAVQDAKNGSQVAVATLIIATQGMQSHGPDAEMDLNQIGTQATQLMHSPGFRNLMRDPEAKEYWETGKAQQLVDLKKDYDNPNMTYRKYLRTCKRDAQNLNEPTALLAANMVAASMLMQSVGPNTEIDQNDVTQMAAKLMRQSAFKEMLKDPKTLDLMKEGKGVGMVELMAQKQNERLHRNDAYERTKGQLKDDAGLLSDYLKSVTGTADAGAVNLTRKSSWYKEMIQQMQAAQTKMAAGIPLSGDENKALCNAVMKLNNNGTEYAGGFHAKNKFYTQNMTFLKRYMPPKDFNDYCRAIKEQNPMRETVPENFVPARMTGKAKTAGELKAEYKAKLIHGFSEESVAAICAINKMSKGDRHCLITTDRLKFETKKMMAHGSAFHRTVINAQDKKVLKDLSEAGHIEDLTKEVQNRSIKHTVGTCQWYLNRSVKALTSGPVNHHEAAFNLAAVVAAGSVAQNAKNLSMPIDKNAFSQAIQATMASKDFQRMVNRYETDPNYRQNINSKLTQNGGAVVSQELYKYEHETAKKQAPAAQPQA